MKLVLGTVVGLSPGDFVLDGEPASLPQKGAERPSPICGPFLLWQNSWMHQDATWYGCRPQPRGLCDRWGSSPPSLKGSGAPKFSIHIYCDQTAGYIKMPLGMDVDLSPGNIVLDGDPVPLPNKGADWNPPTKEIFGPCLLWPNGWMDQDAT